MDMSPHMSLRKVQQEPLEWTVSKVTRTTYIKDLHVRQVFLSDRYEADMRLLSINNGFTM